MWTTTNNLNTNPITTFTSWRNQQFLPSNRIEPHFRPPPPPPPFVFCPPRSATPLRAVHAAWAWCAGGAWPRGWALIQQHLTAQKDHDRPLPRVAQVLGRTWRTSPSSGQIESGHHLAGSSIFISKCRLEFCGDHHGTKGQRKKGINTGLRTFQESI